MSTAIDAVPVYDNVNEVDLTHDYNASAQECETIAVEDMVEHEELPLKTQSDY